MIRSLLFSLFLFFSVLSSDAQKITGQWKGFFIDNSNPYTGWGGEKCDYVLELDTKGNQVFGYSYTYFTDEGKNYYTICRLEGTIDPKKKYVEVREIERTKTNVPNNIRNCFQVHKLTYVKTSDNETLSGEWVPLPNQIGDCGYGTTRLTRRTLKKDLFNANSGLARSAPPIRKQHTPPNAAKKINPPIAKVTRPHESTETAKDPAMAHVETESAKAEIEGIEKDNPPAEFQKRNFNILKTIEVINDVIRVDLYDNGEIDGDSISLYYNEKLILSNKRLSDKPITVKLNVDNNSEVNELVMFAENLGTIPPNTALMIVTDGPNRYEVRITSDLKKSGVIRFVHKQR